MLRFGIQSKCLLVLLCILVVTMRVGGAHIHFCLDGSEPPAALHLGSDLSEHHDHELSAIEHLDIDVPVNDDAFIKKAFSTFDLAALIVALFCLQFLLPFLRQFQVDRKSRSRLRSPPSHLRPPLRGPPSLVLP